MMTRSTFFDPAHQILAITVPWERTFSQFLKVEVASL